jgi:D-amino peptidase
VGLVAGDRAACDEARALLGDVETVAVKEGVSRSAARCLPLERARELIEEAACRAVRRATDFLPFSFTGPVTVEIVFVDPSFADVLEPLDFLTRVDGRTIRFEAADYLSAFECFNALHFLAPVVR